MKVGGVGNCGAGSWKIRKDEVGKSLKRMKNGKAVCPDDILEEVWKGQGEKT